MSSRHPPHDRPIRARGALLGHAAGNALGLPTEFLGSARGDPGGRSPAASRDILRQEPPDAPGTTTRAGRHPGRGAADRRRRPRTAGRTAGRLGGADGRGIGHWTRTALDHIADPRHPAVRHWGAGAQRRGPGPVPAGRARHPGHAGQPGQRDLHTARATHPDERCAWGAVAVNVAAARCCRDTATSSPM